MQYILIHYLDEATLRWDDEERSVFIDSELDRAVHAWDTEMLERGILVGGNALRPASEATTLRVRGGELAMTDGPFAETKEQIAGFSVLECADLEQAVEVASRHPTAWAGYFELRLVQQ
jgi:hypothetical protein